MKNKNLFFILIDIEFFHIFSRSIHVAANGRISLFFSLLHNTSFVATLNGLEIIIFSEISQRKTNLYDITYVGNLKIKLCKVHRKTQI